jgi:ABC-type uncharacterized transport system involved in gliding motility auxiliary subunit
MNARCGSPVIQRYALCLISRDVMIVGTHDERKAMPDLRKHLFLVILPVADLSKFEHINVRLRKIYLDCILNLVVLPTFSIELVFLSA